MLVIKDLSYAYNGGKALSRVSFSLPKGDFLSVLGANGSGKTTLLKNLAGVLSPQIGSITLDGVHQKSVSQRHWAQRVALLPQDFHTPFDFSVEEVVAMGRLPHSRGFFESAEDWQIAQQAMATTAVKDLAKRKLHTLSGGERQRVLIARALAQEPRLLLLDEPTSSLDLKHQSEMLMLVSKFAKERGIMVVAAMHQINVALQYSDKLLLLKAGRMLAAGVPADIVSSATMSDLYETSLVVTKDVNGTLLVSYRNGGKGSTSRR